jgi:hypothetical protein
MEYGNINNHIRGEQTEISFRKTAESLGWFWIPSTKFENSKYHIDCKVAKPKDSRFIDVKALRSFNSIFTNQKVVVEFVNANGDPGSLFGQAEWFAFEMDVEKGTFIVAPQKPLIQLVMNSGAIMGRMHSRKGLDDHYTWLNTSYLHDIGSEIWRRT